MQIVEDTKLDYQDVLIRPNRTVLTSRSEVNLIRDFKYGNGQSFSGVPIIASNMNTGTFKMLDVFSKNKMFVAINKYYDWMDNEFLTEKKVGYLSNRDTIFYSTQDQDMETLERFLDYGFYTIGMNEKELERLIRFYEFLFDMNNEKCFENKLKICIDIANGYIHTFPEFIRKVRKIFPNNYIITGNVCTSEMTQELILAGASGVKIGIGSGFGCTTRKKTSIGYPQLSAIIENAFVAHGLNAHIIADGGIRLPADFSKALVANADFVMAGGFFSGTTECDAEIITKYYETDELEWNEENGKHSKKIIEKKFMEFYGMSSKHAQDRFNGGMNNYRSSEGSYELVEYKGDVQNIIDDLLGGIRSCATYIGAKNIKDFGKCGTFIKVNRVHDKF